MAAGHRLVFCPAATSTHRWRDDLAGYLRQQYGVGYGRLDLLARHPRRFGGDDVSGALMMAHGPLMLMRDGERIRGGRWRRCGSSPWRCRRRLAARAVSLFLRTHCGGHRRLAPVRRSRRRSRSAPRISLRDVAWAAAIVRLARPAG